MAEIFRLCEFPRKCTSEFPRALGPTSGISLVEGVEIRNEFDRSQSNSSSPSSSTTRLLSRTMLSVLSRLSARLSRQDVVLRESSRCSAEATMQRGSSKQSTGDPVSRLHFPSRRALILRLARFSPYRESRESRAKNLPRHPARATRRDFAIWCEKCALRSARSSFPSITSCRRIREQWTQKTHMSH